MLIIGHSFGHEYTRVLVRARSDTARRKGNIEERGGALRVRLYAGLDPVTGKPSYKRATIQGTDDAAWRKAEDKLTEFRAEVLKQRSASMRQAIHRAHHRGGPRLRRGRMQAA